MSITTKVMKGGVPSSVLLNITDGRDYFFGLGKTAQDLDDALHSVVQMQPFHGLAFPLLFGRVLVLQRMPGILGVAWFNRSVEDHAEHEAMLGAEHVH